MNLRKAPLAGCAATRLTPSGRGAVAVIALAGERAVEYAARHFQAASHRSPDRLPLQRMAFGRWGHADGPGEEVVVVRTAATELEVHCHGGVAASRAIIETLVADGAVEQPAEVWARRQSGDVIEAEAWLALADARTERTASILLDQYRGALRRAIQSAIEALRRGDSFAAADALELLRARRDVGLHLTRPWRVAFAGPPNVGKSSLVNRLLGYQRSIVFDQPGTTRDLLSATTALDGWSMELIDMAGICESEDIVEREGVFRAMHCLAEADLVILVFDVTRDWTAEQSQLLAACPNALRVVNKCDLRDVLDDEHQVLRTVATTGAGVPELMQRIVNRLVTCDVQPGDAVPFTIRHVQAIAAAIQSLAAGQQLPASDILTALIAGS